VNKEREALKQPIIEKGGLLTRKASFSGIAKPYVPPTPATPDKEEKKPIAAHSQVSINAADRVAAIFAEDQVANGKKEELAIVGGAPILAGTQTAQERAEAERERLARIKYTIKMPLADRQGSLHDPSYPKPPDPWAEEKRQTAELKRSASISSQSPGGLQRTTSISKSPPRVSLNKAFSEEMHKSHQPTADDTIKRKMTETQKRRSEAPTEETARRLSDVTFDLKFGA
jgi:hypothetical protein